MEEPHKQYILWIDQLRKNNVDLAGGKGANLGELVSIKVPVPPGFVVTTQAYKDFLKSTGLEERIASILREVDVNDKASLDRASSMIRQLIMEAPMPKEIEESIRGAYRELARRLGIAKPLVAVRSSASAEDLPEASFAGQQETYLNVMGEDEVVAKVKSCWASLFTSRAIFYRVQHKIDHQKVAMAVVVQKMVNSKSAGVLFTLHPVTGDNNVIVIESSWGLGEAVVGGKVTPDEIVIDKKTLSIVEKRVGRKEMMIIYDAEKKRNVEVKVPEELVEKPSITDEEAIALAKYGLLIEEHYGAPMDVEWAIDRDIPPPNNIFIVQARYETVWSRKLGEKPAAKEAKEAKKTGVGSILVRGLPASPGIATGVARVLFNPFSKEAQEFDGPRLCTVNKEGCSNNYR